MRWDVRRSPDQVEREARAALLLLAALGDLPKGGYPELARQLGTTEEDVGQQVHLLTLDARARRQIRRKGSAPQGEP